MSIWHVVYVLVEPCRFIAFPWYRLSALLFRLGALCQNILVYSFERENIKIGGHRGYSHHLVEVLVGTREDEIRDIPPCPPHMDVDWFRVWEESDTIDKLSTPERQPQLSATGKDDIYRITHG